MKKIIHYFILFFICLAPIYGQSPLTEERTERALREPDEEDLQSDNQFYNELMNIVFALALIVFLMIVAAYFLRRFMAGRMEQMNVSSTIKIMDQRNLSTKTVLYIVEVYDKQVLIGESATGVVGLAVFPVEGEKSFQDVYDRKGE
ncbi:MAG: hypothetical protein K940chlam3_01565 [Chlamydiae bacterium]|nr:hypothetical protein [Chlamydiota bacterium]